MTYSTRTIGIASSSLIAVILVGTAYALSGPLPFLTKTADAESTHDLLVSYAAKDTDNDGLPDWEESLYGTDPANPHSVNASVTDGDAVSQGLVKPKFASATTTPVDINKIPGTVSAPTTITDKFARKLFENYLTSRGPTAPTAKEIATFVETGVTDLRAGQVVPDAFNLGQVRVSGEGPEALTAYAKAAEAVFAAKTVPTTQSEIVYFSDAVNKDDAAALAKVASIGKAYGEIGRGLIKITVPKEAATGHLALANALMQMSDVTLDLASIKDDPFRAMLALGEYEGKVRQLAQSLSLLNTSFTAEGVTIPVGVSGSSFRTVLQYATDSLVTPKK